MLSRFTWDTGSVIWYFSNKYFKVLQGLTVILDLEILGKHEKMELIITLWMRSIYLVF